MHWKRLNILDIVGDADGVAVCAPVRETLLVHVWEGVAVRVPDNDRSIA